MLEYLKNEANKTYTENGAAALKTSGSECLDLFASIGAMRHAADEAVTAKFVRAFAEDADTAMKILFYARDIRGGLGERRVFRTIIKWLAFAHPSVLRKNIAHIPEYGRFDDLLSLLGTPCEKDALELIRKQLAEDSEALKDETAPVSLLGKWLPSVNASSSETVRNAKRIVRALGTTDAEYRRLLTALRSRIRIVENNLRERDYTFDYEKLPSRAAFRYRSAFYRNDAERYGEFLGKVERGEATLKTGGVMPYELVERYLGDQYWCGSNQSFMRAISESERASLNATWKSFEDFTSSGNALAVVDTSGSMYWQHAPMPAAVALSLGLYFAERNKGMFQNHFMMFSDDPQLIEIKGETFCDKLQYISTFNEVGSTNIDSMFELILNTAVNNKLSQSELPEQLVIISDMEFNYCIDNASLTNFENAKQRFAEHGYALPRLVFWNVASRHGHQPVTMNEQGVILVSGCTPRLFSMISAGADITPYKLMMDVIGSERYAVIAA